MKKKNKITHEQIENRLDRETEKAVWSMIRDSRCGEVRSSDIRNKLGEGVYPAIDKLITMGAVVKIKRGLYAVSSEVTK